MSALAPRKKVSFVKAAPLLLLTIYIVLVISALCCVPSRAADNWPKPITSSKSESPAKIGTSSSSVLSPIGVPNASTAPGTITTPLPSTITPTISESRQLLLPALLDRMQKGELMPQKAWDDKLMDIDDLLWIFTNKIDPWGGFYWEKNLSLRRALEKVLAENGGGKLAVPEKLPAVIRLWLADYYGSIKDEKCLGLCESILSEYKEPVKGENPLLFQTIERIAWYYGLQGKHLKAAQAWERFLPLSATTGWWTPDVILETARGYSKAGDKIKAFFLYAKIPLYGNGWVTGMSYIDQAADLMLENNHQQAREMLKRYVSGDRADEIRVAMLTLLARSYLKTGETSKAAQYAQQALDQFKSLTNYHFNDGTEWMVIEAKDILKETK